MQGINSFRRLGYDGPCRPAGPPHHYQWTLYALDHSLDLEPATTFETLQKAMEGHILGRVQLKGLFQRENDIFEKSF